MFLVGDKVVHPMHGAGIIDSITTEKIGGAVHEDYVFKMPINSLVLKVPTTSVDLIGIRPIGSREQLEAVVVMLPQMPFEMSNNWNQRYRENLERLKSGDPMEVALVIKGLMYRDLRRGLSTGERKMLHTAKQILISEISLAENMDYDTVSQRISAAMQQM